MDLFSKIHYQIEYNVVMKTTLVKLEEESVKGLLIMLGETQNLIFINIKKKKTLWPLFMDGVQLPQGLSHFEEAVYFLPLSSQKFLVLNLSTSGG